MGGQEAFRHIDMSLSFRFSGRIVKDYGIYYRNISLY